MTTTMRGLVKAIKSANDDTREFWVTPGNGRALWVTPPPEQWSEAGRAAAAAAGYEVVAGRDGDYVVGPSDAPEYEEE